MTKQKYSPQDELQQITLGCEYSYGRWQHYFEGNGVDPTWTDGENMNLIRNHIIHHKQRMKELCEKFGLELPKVYYHDTPKEMPNDFMAFPERILKNAYETLEFLSSHSAYIQLLSFDGVLSKKQREQINYDYVIGMVPHLKSAIDSQNYVRMRCYSKPHLRAINEEILCTCLEKAKVSKPEEYVPVQLTLFDL